MIVLVDLSSPSGALPPACCSCVPPAQVAQLTAQLPKPSRTSALYLQIYVPCREVQNLHLRWALYLSAGVDNQCLLHEINARLVRCCETVGALHFIFMSSQDSPQNSLIVYLVAEVLSMIERFAEVHTIFHIVNLMQDTKDLGFCISPSAVWHRLTKRETI